MKELLSRIAGHLKSGSYVNEAGVRIGIIEPILVHLGWDITDPLTVIPEYNSEGRRVDYALCAFPRRPAAFIEAKAIGKVEAADRQLFEYAFHEGVPFAVLTDGRTWSFYLPSAQGSYEDRRLHKLDLQERPLEESERILTRYLGYRRMRSGETHSDAQKDYASRANERVATDTISRAWIELVGEPDPLLIDLLVERTEALCGIRPALEAAEEFLLATMRRPGTPPPPPRLKVLTSLTPPLHEEVPEAAIPPGRIVALFKDRQLSAKDATAGFLEILRALAAAFPDRMEQIATAAKGRARNHIARTSREVYPNRPDLVKSVVELVPGWFVGINIANREKRRIVKAACDACGVQFGRDVIFDLPNA